MAVYYKGLVKKFVLLVILPDTLYQLKYKNLKGSFEIRLYIFCLFLLNILMSLISLTDPSVLLSG